MKKIVIVICFFFTTNSFAENLYKPESQQALNNFAQYFIKYGIEQTLKGKNVNPFLIKNVVTASKVIADYKANQLKANKIYEGKYTRIQTVANRIDAGVFNSPFIVAYGKNQFEEILIYINPNDARFLDIQAGNKIDLICKGNGYQLTSPAFNSCMFTKDYLDKVEPILITNLKKASDSNYKPNSLEEAKILLIYLALEPVFQAACEASIDDCTKNLNAKDSKISKEEPQKTPKVQALINYIDENPPKSIMYQF